MGRLLVLVLLVVLAVWLLRRAFRKAPPRQAQRQDQLVQCARCGVHLPRAEARLASGALYCSDEHARLGAR